MDERGQEQLASRLHRRSESCGIAGTASPRALPANSLCAGAAAALAQHRRKTPCMLVAQHKYSQSPFHAILISLLHIARAYARAQ